MRIVGIIGTVLCAAIFTISISSPSAGREILVPGDFPTIRAAVDAAGDGDSIVVSPGTYREIILILKPNVQLHLIGKGKPTLKEMIKIVDAKWVTVEGFKMIGGTDESHGGIVSQNSSITLKDMEISGFHHGVLISNGSAEISNCRITDSFNVCVQVSYGDLLLTDSILADSGTGLILSGGGVMLIKGNSFIGNEIGIQCVDSAPVLRRNLIKGNGYGLMSIDARPNLGSEDDFGENSLIANEVHIHNQGAKAISAIGNYWGDPEGPPLKSIEGKVLFKPWLIRGPLSKVGLREEGKVTLLWAEMKIESPCAGGCRRAASATAYDH